MTTHDEALTGRTAAQTVLFLGAAGGLTDQDVAAPCRLPGWTRGHLLAHVTQQALGLAGVLAAAARGEVASMYPSQQARNDAIEEAAGRSAAAHLQHLARASAQLARAWAQLPDDRLDVQFTAPAGWFRPASDASWFRWRELALHRVDLAAPGPQDDPLSSWGDLAGRLLGDTVDTFSARPGFPALELTATDLGRSWTLGDPGNPGAPALPGNPGDSGGRVAVGGSAAALALWLTGRSEGTGLASSGPLPELPPWV